MSAAVQVSAVLAATTAADASTIVSGSLLVAVPLAALAGLVSFASPCVLPLVPGYLSYVTGLTGVGLARKAADPSSAVPGQPRLGPEARTPQPARTTTTTPSTHAAAPLAAADAPAMISSASAESMALADRPPRARIVTGTLLFIGGFSAVFVSYGAAFGGLGATLLEHQEALTRLLGIVVIVLGFGFLGLLPMLQREVRWHARPRRGLWAAPLLGALFGLGWTPCIGPTLAAVQSLAFTEASAARGALLSVAYCLGLGLPFLVVGLAMERGLGAMAWARRHARGIQITGGVCLILLGLVLVSGVWGTLMIELRTWVTGWTVPL